MVLTKWHKTLALAVSLAGFTSIFGVNQVHAQDADNTPPVIHSLTVTTAPGQEHYFSADIKDDVAVDNVFLYYRQEGIAGDFVNVAMTQLKDDEKKLFKTQIVMDAGADSVIEYILKASDKAGNQAQRGGIFDPTLSSTGFNRTAQNIAGDSSANTAPGSGPGSGPILGKSSNEHSSEMSTRKKILYAVLGILTVGVLASLDSGEKTPDDCDAMGCRVTITAPALQLE